MKKLSAVVFLIIFVAAPVLADNPRVWLQTDRGVIVLELDAVLAPGTTQNFVDYVEEGFFDGLVFHRAIKDFVIQGGGFDRNFAFRQPTHAAISSEASNGLANVDGAIAMALSGNNVNSAQTQFFINTGTNAHLDDNFTVFGQVIMGQNTVSTINNLQTGTKGTPLGTFQDAPLTPPVIERAVVFHGDFPIMPLHSGSWFDPANAGVGFNIEVTNDATTEDGPLMVVYWYDYNQGQPMWLTGIAAFDFGATEVSVDLLSAPHPDPSADFQIPPPFSDLQVQGTLNIRFSDCLRGHFSYDLPDFGQGEINVTRLTLPDQTSCEGLLQES
jgi:peptidyl-prolyl cis-trans isomerase A (cyclophilin A)